MPRPRKWRRIKYLNNLEGEINLEAEEIEALRLVDFEGKSQEEAAQMMGISQPTLSRILEKARKKIVEAALNQKKIGIINKTRDKMRIAIPYKDGEVDEHFGMCEEFVIVELENGEIKEKKTEKNPSGEGRGRGRIIADFLKSKGVNAVVVSYLGEGISRALSEAGISVYVGNGKIEDIIEKIKNNELEAKKAEFRRGQKGYNNRGRMI